jgi:hypothetical protein
MGPEGPVRSAEGVPETVSVSARTWDGAGSQPSGPCREPLDGPCREPLDGPCREPLDCQDFEAQMASARMTVGETLATTPCFEEDEWAGPPPLTDAELDDAIVRLVRLYPGWLGRPRIAHILAGHRGRKINAKYSHLPDYGARSVRVARAGAPRSHSTPADGTTRATRRQPAAPRARCRRRQVAAEARPLSTAIGDVSAETRR